MTICTQDFIHLQWEGLCGEIRWMERRQHHRVENLYVYVQDNPLNAKDPTGLKTYLTIFASKNDPCTQKVLENLAKKEAKKFEAVVKEGDSVIVAQVSTPVEVVSLQQTNYEIGSVDLSIIAHATAAEDENTVAGMLMSTAEEDKIITDPKTGINIAKHKVSFEDRYALTA